MMLPVSWQIGCDLSFANWTLRSMIFNADSAIVPFFSCSSARNIAACTSPGISAEVRRINSISELSSAVITTRKLSGVASKSSRLNQPRCEYAALELLEDHFGARRFLISHFAARLPRALLEVVCGNAHFAVRQQFGRAFHFGDALVVS